jgi:hypothetical protein
MLASERTVRVGLMSYVDVNGAHRYALEGAVVQVHPDRLERFDRLNRLPGESEPEPPKRRRTTKG